MTVVTQEMLAQLRAERSTQKPTLDYTMDGPVQQQVHQRIDQEREKKIAHGEQSMQDALQNLRVEQAFATREGYSKAHFNQAKETL